MKRSLPKAKLQEVRDTAEAELFAFAKLVNPTYKYGEVHKRAFRWLQDGSGDMHQLLLLPRAHLKSHCMAVWCAWYITKHPEITILYLSATAELAEKQLYDIKNMMTSTSYKRVWPQMINVEEGKREKWSTTKMAVDHPARKRAGTKDWTISTAGLTTGTTGWHADVIIPDDTVTPENAYTESGRLLVATKMAQMNSILNPGGIIKACGTRYHPQDYYNILMNTEEPEWNEDFSDIVSMKPVWDVFEDVVEMDNVFLWPRIISEIDGKPYGFDIKTLGRIKSGYGTDPSQFFAQYYNDPNDSSTDMINRDTFKYFEPAQLARYNGQWFYGRERTLLNIYGAIDFAFSRKKTADFTAIVVIGLDADGNYYVLDIARFKTDKISTYFDNVVSMHDKWGIKVMRAEISVAQKVIVEDLKDKIKREGMSLKIDEYRPNRHEGTKQERISSTLDHKYEQGAMFHFPGGYTPLLEEELVLARPPHDDIKDALACAVDVAKKPFDMNSRGASQESNLIIGRFGGIVGMRS